ncbi:hypothetical protein T07_13863 [Trichinella nelsoni]|uniref:Uncharacterized protein n=1 Tax=Trichinella nelsoni TaxID=6336 RepID=A0A0V0SBV0_9BILA|nr:hypothetical protein T07_13863 [Trichinella nelsoni]
MQGFLQFLGKYAFMKRATRFVSEKLIGSRKFHGKPTRKQPIWNSVDTDRRWFNFGIGKL